MAKQDFDSREAGALQKLDTIYQQLRNSVVVDGREFRVECDRSGSFSTLKVVYGMTELETKKDAELREKLEAKRKAKEAESIPPKPLPKVAPSLN